MRIFVSLVVLLFAMASLAVGGSTKPTTSTISKPAGDPTVAALSRLSGSAFEIAYLQALVPEDEEVIEVAYVATHGGDHPELLQWNQVMIDRKGAQVRQALALLQEAGATAPKRNVGVVTPAVKQMRGLGGAALEQAYVAFITKHFDRDIALAQLAMKKASRPGVKSLAQSRMQVERQETTMVRGWMKKWYGK